MKKIIYILFLCIIIFILLRCNTLKPDHQNDLIYYENIEILAQKMNKDPNFFFYYFEAGENEIINFKDSQIIFTSEKNSESDSINMEICGVDFNYEASSIIQIGSGKFFEAYKMYIIPITNSQDELSAIFIKIIDVFIIKVEYAYCKSLNKPMMVVQLKSIKLTKDEFMEKQLEKNFI